MSNKLNLLFNRKMPFKLSSDNTPEELLSQISESKINFEDGNWRQVSNEAKVRLASRLIKLFSFIDFLFV